MAYFTVRNSLNPGKAVVFGITYQKLVDKNSYDGEAIWVLTVATDEPDINGDSIAPYIINLVTLDDVDEEIKKAVAYLSDQIDWEPLADDTRAPYVSSTNPETSTIGIWEDVRATITEIYPSAGIDPDSLRMFVNGVEVTSELEITGDTYEYTISWAPDRLFVQEP